jgi:hypothetical protein
VPGISFMVLAFAAAWWVGFLALANYRGDGSKKCLCTRFGLSLTGPSLRMKGREGRGEGGMKARFWPHETVLGRL